MCLPQTRVRLNLNPTDLLTVNYCCGHDSPAAGVFQEPKPISNKMMQRDVANLHQCQVLLPPDVLGVHAHEVVRVHNRVDEAVEDDRQVHVAVVAGVHVQPVELPWAKHAGTKRRRAYG